MRPMPDGSGNHAHRAWHDDFPGASVTARREKSDRGSRGEGVDQCWGVASASNCRSISAAGKGVRLLSVSRRRKKESTTTVGRACRSMMAVISGGMPSGRRPAIQSCRKISRAVSPRTPSSRPPTCHRCPTRAGQRLPRPSRAAGRSARRAECSWSRNQPGARHAANLGPASTAPRCPNQGFGNSTSAPTLRRRGRPLSKRPRGEPSWGRARSPNGSDRRRCSRSVEAISGPSLRWSSTPLRAARREESATRGAQGAVPGSGSSGQGGQAVGARRVRPKSTPDNPSSPRPASADQASGGLRPRPRHHQVGRRTANFAFRNCCWPR